MTEFVAVGAILKRIKRHPFLPLSLITNSEHPSSFAILIGIQAITWEEQFGSIFGFFQGMTGLTGS